ncbi:papain fold toxin 1 (glutamine deamidase) of polymorphic toxin system [Herbihabitans rhizosphaerae]|uniref:Papain fold toxin 1 (Glutamine deamidase) of polymorphic toxin system n=1 Tax=Herbihabitans rhizosphaerae TaxID=1872711 RepID=A0A4Q7L5N7_9PSEU|nr:YrhB domain-containing protein [Herbihabitans rhizosphaerae]RZS44959.1 papain fold toxin 1 (glutamine deamidase) of polymorphic toxin system [Herbihabitans rhizosphaerae]
MTHPDSREAVRRARSWLSATYGARVELARDEPVAEAEHAWLFACRLHGSDAPMLNASVVVPKNHRMPFQPANSDPWGDFSYADPRQGSELVTRSMWRTNARACMVATDAAMNGSPMQAWRWTPGEETADWWDQFVARHFPTAETQACQTWDDVTRFVRQPGGRGIVWVRREVGGVEATGHLIYAYYDEQAGAVAYLDAQIGGMAKLEQEHVRGLTAARFTSTPPQSRPAWTSAAPDLTSAVAKAEGWLALHYGDEVVLDRPSPQDETRRGWLFAATTRMFQRCGDWRAQMLDAAVVVPKDTDEPFSLDNSDPWNWLGRWDSGGDTGKPPVPGPAAWFRDAMPNLGEVISANQHPHWQSVFGELNSFPEGARAVVWVRRADRAGRETVGMLFNATRTNQGAAVVDSTRNAQANLETQGIIAVHVIRYR